jgi:hypothetical protein
LGTVDDRLAITEVCSAFGWLADRRRWEDLEAVFAPQVDLDYTSLNGGEPVKLDASAIVAGWREAFAAMTATQHLIAGHLVEVDGDRATCTANFQATHLGPAPDGDSAWTLGGHYLFGLVREGGGWRIGSLTMTAVWQTGSREAIAAASA